MKNKLKFNLLNTIYTRNVTLKSKKIGSFWTGQTLSSNRSHTTPVCISMDIVSFFLLTSFSSPKYSTEYNLAFAGKSEQDVVKVENWDTEPKTEEAAETA